MFRSVPNPVKSSKVLSKVLDLMPVSEKEDLMARSSVSPWLSVGVGAHRSRPVCLDAGLLVPSRLAPAR